MAADQAPESFWDFSLRVYPRVEDLCLRLQDEAGFEVNLLLWVIWMGQNGRAIDHTLGDAVRLAHGWSAAVGGLRQVRRALRAPPAGMPATDPLRAQVAACELEAEKLLQEALQTLALGAAPQTGGAVDVYAAAQDMARRMGADAHHPDLAILVKTLIG